MKQERAQGTMKHIKIRNNKIKFILSQYIENSGSNRAVVQETGQEASLGDAVGYLLRTICFKVVSVGDTRSRDSSGNRIICLVLLLLKKINSENRMR